MGVKAPIQEILRCPLAFAGVHLLKDLPEYPQVAYHYCKALNDDVSQCVLYDGTGPDARLIGIEYLVSDALYQKMPPEEKTYWHDHKYEVDSGLLKSLTQAGPEAKQTLANVRTLWGKVFHTWASGKMYPSGPPRLFWAVTGEEPFVLSPDAKLPVELEERRAKKEREVGVGEVRVSHEERSAHGPKTVTLPIDFHKSSWPISRSKADPRRSSP